MKSIRAAIRYFLFVAATLGIYSIWWLGAIFVGGKTSWRQTIFRSWAKSFVSISKMKIEVVGDAPKPPFFLVFNHLGYVDIAAIRAVTEGIFVAKGEIESWFLAGRIIRDMGTIFINRNNRRDIPRAGAEIIEHIKQGEGVIIFPEGTSTKGENVLPFNSSFLEFAAQSNLPVSYASISYKTVDAHENASDFVCWWDDISFGAHLWKLFQLKEYKATITFGDEPIQNPNRKQLAAELREKVEEKFTPVT